MPYWKTHIEIGKRINKYLKYEKDDLDCFLFACVAPDINNSELLANIASFIPHDITHFKNKKQETFMKFYEKYQKEIKAKDPIFMGYFLHLFVDYYWNSNFYSNVKNTIYKNKKSNQLKDVKHHDFNVYNNRFAKNKLNINNKDKLLSELKKIKEIEIKEKDIIFVENFLQEQKLASGTLHCFTKAQLDKIVNNTVKNFRKDFLS